MTGLAESVVKGKNTLDLFPFLKETGNDLLMKQALAGISAESPDFEFVIPSTGKKGWARSVFSPNYNASGRIIGIIGVIRDITTYKQAERSLRESQERYRNVVEDQTEFISRFLPDGTHVFVNEAFCRYYDRKRNEILGHRFRPGIPAEDLERVKTFFASLTPDHPVGVIEHRIVMPDGALRWQRWTDRAIFDPRGKVTEFQSVGQDITEEQATKNALQKSEKRFRELADLLPQGVYEADTEGNLTYANQTAFLRFGYTENDLRQGLSIRQMIAPGDLERALLSFHTMAAGKRTTPGSVEKFMALRKDGSTFPVSIYSSPIVVNERIAGLRGVIVESTEQERADERLQPTREYEETGAGSQAWQHCRTLVDRAAAQVAPRNVVLKNDLPYGIEVLADPLISRIFYNLADNAVRHGRKITTIRFSAEESGHDLLITCEDNGDGIPVDLKNKIFERGFGKHTGFGLFLSREILSITGIAIRETGEPGNGARFEIRIPEGYWRYSGD
jgi:PAS domain S-box-containing protein